ncbi:glu S.griseus protease inhibitor-like [Rutidosis leptorrhynchoides]|uniref:glu S.griseus protease inhibitor-like n=1 Tax=Rutidosis leptorrhynchoides TaxID=125765 RepID=UPI003A9A3427
MASCDTGHGKKSWPELVGTPSEAARFLIERENNNVDAVIVEEGSLASSDFRCDRVRVFVDDNNIVKQVPKVG